MTTIYVVSTNGEPCSVWSTLGDAEAAAGEAAAMDPEQPYSVEEISGEDVAEFWFWNPQL